MSKSSKEVKKSNKTVRVSKAVKAFSVVMASIRFPERESREYKRMVKALALILASIDS